MANIIIRASKKNMSAYFSNLKPEVSLVLLIDKNDSRLLAISKTEAAPVNSSIIDISLYLLIFNDVKTMRQNPSRLEDVFKM